MSTRPPDCLPRCGTGSPARGQPICSGREFSDRSIPVLVIVVVAVTGHLVLTRTRLGRYAYAMGSNAEAARLSGIPMRRHLTGVYVICGALAGLGGMIDASRINSGSRTSAKAWSSTSSPQW